MKDLLRCAWRAGAAALLVASAAASANAQAWFATECQKDYQYGWQKKLNYSYTRCSMFNHELDDTDLPWYYWNLVGAKWRWEDTGDEFAMDDVDLLYACTHGGASATDSRWTMWDNQQRAFSSQMRLGDEAWGLSLLATYSCNTLRTSDGLHWTRMSPIFKGGLRYAMGSHDKVYDGETTDEVGEDFADGLQKGKSLKYAWKDGNSDWDADQDLTVMATGANSGDCWNRRDYMTWQNFPYYPRLRDGQVGWRCFAHWDDI